MLSTLDGLVVLGADVLEVVFVLEVFCWLVFVELVILYSFLPLPPRNKFS